MDNKRFREFRLGDIFEKLSIKKASKKKLRKKPSEEYSVPVVYAKYGNNGIMYWGKKQDFQTYENTISIIYNGVISAGKVYAQERATGVLAESYLIRLKGNPNVPFEANLYMAIAIECAIYPKYSREDLATWDNKVENEKIMLPLKDDEDNLDFDYMKSVILNEKRVYERRLDMFLEKNDLDDCNLDSFEQQALSKDVVYKQFKMNDLFEKCISSYKGKGRKQDNVSKTRTEEFSLPLINCKDGDNGVMYYGRKKDFSSHKNVLSIIYNGPPTEGQTYYQEEIGLYTDAYIVKMKTGTIPNTEVGLYLATVINKSIHNLDSKKYSRGDKATWEGKVENDYIALPICVDDNGEAIIDPDRKYHPKGFLPDFDYMYYYIRAVKKEVFQNVINNK